MNSQDYLDLFTEDDLCPARRESYEPDPFELVRLFLVKLDRDMRLLSVLGNGRSFGDMLQEVRLPPCK